MTPTYRSWIAMIGRCTNPKNANYRKYGAIGITVCERWLDFNSFVKDVGIRPSLNLTIDRLNNTGNYEPGNVRWATHVEQSNNKRTNRMVTIDGITETITKAALRRNIPRTLIYRRLRDGWNVERAFSEPSDISKNRNPIGKNQFTTP